MGDGLWLLVTQRDKSRPSRPARRKPLARIGFRPSSLGGRTSKNTTARAAGKEYERDENVEQESADVE